MPLARLLLALPLLAACAAPAAPPPTSPPSSPQPVLIAPREDRVRLQVAPLAARAGGEVTLTLINGRDEEVGYNLCTSRLERILRGIWVTVPQDLTCTRELRIVPPGGRAHFARRLPAGLPPGLYRFSTMVQAPLAGGRRGPLALISNRFELR